MKEIRPAMSIFTADVIMNKNKDSQAESKHRLFIKDVSKTTEKLK